MADQTIYENVNDIYFDGYYKEIWRAFIPSELTAKESDFMAQYFNLTSESRVLDLMCGYGRHALALSKKGIHVTAVDNLSDYIIEIKKNAEQEQLPLTAIRADIIRYEPEGQYDLAICMGNSFNFFEAYHAQNIITMVAAHLKPGGHFLINTWTLAEIVIKYFKDRYWSEINGIKFLTESKFLFHPTRMETESIMIAQDGKTETKTGVDYIYSLSEMEVMLKNAGLTLEATYTVPGKKHFSLGDARAYLIARK
ncbi:MAG: class I SAM-dependent methyltransferase [Bacteroidetes bacterium]|nr:class I SAM-dependent methyltransferase [Bacteroidota bacterium]MBS1931462.1 class I SAM-dependent methyltransferase [Bacteroidota bacterium]